MVATMMSTVPAPVTSPTTGAAYTSPSTSIMSRHRPLPSMMCTTPSCVAMTMSSTDASFIPGRIRESTIGARILSLAMYAGDAELAKAPSLPRNTCTAPESVPTTTSNAPSPSMSPTLAATAIFEWRSRVQSCSPDAENATTRPRVSHAIKSTSPSASTSTATTCASIDDTVCGHPRAGAPLTPEITCTFPAVVPTMTSNVPSPSTSANVGGAYTFVDSLDRTICTRSKSNDFFTANVTPSRITTPVARYCDDGA
mmetsp:Transcript_8495/g.31628  ORF Transcript_8495/g.31628 Transcript_8495/m.31628 type:complete len:255 (-) Transcript_8495:944-1708(-)